MNKHTNPDSEIENTCAYENCFNSRDKDLSSTGVQSYFCGYHRQNEGISVESVTYDHKHNSRNNLKRGIEALKHQWQLASEYKIKALSRYMLRLEKDENGCLNWTGPLNRNGYAPIQYNDGTFKTNRVHRAFYHILKGEIPQGMTVDHLCNNRKCQNVDHMVLATLEENSRRGRKDPLKVDYCYHGHHMVGENRVTMTTGTKGNTRTTVRCRECHNIEAAKYRAKKRLERALTIPDTKEEKSNGSK